MIKYISIKNLKIHEKTNRKRLKEIKDDILARRLLLEPLIVDKNTLVILDGHHRYSILKELGAKRLPVYLVDYSDQKIRVQSRRPRIKISKVKVITAALLNQPLPHKTSKHLIPNRPKNINVPLNKMR